MEDVVMHHTTEIRRRSGGSIDTGHYARIGRGLHGAAIRETAASFVRLFRFAVKARGRQRVTSQENSRAEPVFGAAE
jgi:hypothetical protein